MGSVGTMVKSVIAVDFTPASFAGVGRQGIGGLTRFLAAMRDRRVYRGVFPVRAAGWPASTATSAELATNRAQILSSGPSWIGLNLSVAREQPEDGLAAFWDGGKDLILAQARRLSAERRTKPIRRSSPRRGMPNPVPRGSYWTTDGS